MPAHGIQVSGGTVTPAYTIDPVVANNYLGWSQDISLGVSGGNVTPVAATIYLAKIPVPRSITVTTMSVYTLTAGTSYTNAQLGLYDSTGAFLKATAVQASAGTNGFGVTGAISAVNLTATQAIVGGPGVFVWGAIHMGTNAVTSAIFRGFGTAGAANNAGLTAATFRSATQTGHATNDLATIGNLTPTNNVTTALFMWFGLS